MISRLRSYLHSDFTYDLQAGFLVAVIAIPQAMAYAGIAGISPIYGLYTAILPAMIASLAGSSSSLITGPTNATALAVAGVLVMFAAMPNYAEYVFALAILVGVVKLLLGLFRLDGIIRHVPQTVLSGFLTGAAILIILGQLNTIFGLPRPAHGDTLSLLSELLQRLGQTNPYALLIGLISLLLLMVIRRIHHLLPAPLLIILLSTVTVWLTGWDAAGVRLIKDLGMPALAGLSFHVPQIDLSQVQPVLVGAVTVALVSLIETLSVTQNMAMRSGSTLNASREFVGQGLASLVGGFFQAFPPSGSMARSSVGLTSGGRTRMTGVFSGGFVWLMVIIFSTWIGEIPLTALSAIVIYSAARIVQLVHIRKLWTTSGLNRLILAAMLTTTLLLPLPIAIYTGFALSIGVYLYERQRLSASEPKEL